MRTGTTDQDDMRVPQTGRIATGIEIRGGTETIMMIERKNVMEAETETGGERGLKTARIATVIGSDEKTGTKSIADIGTIMRSRGIRDAETKIPIEGQDDEVGVNHQDAAMIKVEHYLMQYATQTKTILVILNHSNACFICPTLKFVLLAVVSLFRA